MAITAASTLIPLEGSATNRGLETSGMVKTIAMKQWHEEEISQEFDGWFSAESEPTIEIPNR